VTGASSGIGDAIARRLAAAGFRVFGASRKAPADPVSGIEHVTIDVDDDSSVRAGVANVLGDAPFYARPQAAGMDVYAGSRGRVFAVMAKYERKAPGPDVVAAKVVAIADNAHPALRNKVTKEATQFTLLRRGLPPGAFENGVRRAFKVEAKGEAQPQGSVT
jgi:NAD(P)-dependent dehydrogenase (short-subunit alcohol dehydrogenase family)